MNPMIKDYSIKDFDEEQANYIEEAHKKNH